MKMFTFDVSIRKYAPIVTTLLVVLSCGSAAMAGTIESCAMGNGPSGTNTVLPADCTGSTSGTLEAWTSSPYSYTTTAGTTSGTVYSAVYDDNGTMDFYYQVINSGTSATSIAQLAANSFMGWTTNAAFITDGSSLAGTGFMDGTIAPQLSNISSGTVVNFDFNAPLATGVIGPGEASYVVIISTNATNWTAGNDTVQDGGSSGPLDAFQPAAPSSGVPEPATLGLMGLGLIGLASLRRRLRRD